MERGRRDGYNSGEYKGRKNFISDVTTALPEEVPKKMQEYGPLAKLFRQAQEEYGSLCDGALMHAEEQEFEKIMK